MRGALRRIALAILAANVCGGCAVSRSEPPSAVPAASGSACVPAGRWIAPATGFAVAHHDVIARAARTRIVLLGEDHDRPAHHRWQHDVIAALHGVAPRLVVGFEMFPRRAQPALDRWVDGDTTEADFLAETDWRRVWGFDADLYWPLFDFVRMFRVPMVGLNVSRSLVARVGKEGWAAIPPADREGLSDPAPASTAYRTTLAEAFAAHRDDGLAIDPRALERFIEAQLVWDRAMAEMLARALGNDPQAVIVGIMGRGHVEHGYGVPAQLAAMGTPGATVLVPWDADRDCGDLTSDLAGAVFGMAPPPPA